MAYVAGSTGGRPLVNSPSLARAARRSLGGTGQLLLASHSNLAPGRRKYHRLEVKLKEMDGVGIRHREGYMDVPLSDGILDRTLAAAVHGFDDNPLGITVATNGAFVPRDDGTVLVPVIITVPIGELVLIPSEDEHRGQISILLTVKDDRGRPFAAADARVSGSGSKCRARFGFESRGPVSPFAWPCAREGSGLRWVSGMILLERKR